MNQVTADATHPFGYTWASLTAAVAWNGPEPMRGEFPSSDHWPAGEVIQDPMLGAGRQHDEAVVVGDIQVTRQRFISADGSLLAFRLHLANGSSEMISIEAVDPIILTDLHLIGDPQAPLICIRQPRHKNDMPAAFRLDRVDEAMLDAVRGMEETGGMRADANGKPPRPSRYISSELTVLAATAGSPDGMPMTALAVGPVPLTAALVSTEVIPSEDGRGIQRLTLTCHGDLQQVEAGSAFTSPWAVLITGTDIDEVVGRFIDLTAAAVAPRSSVATRPPTVWCSWYYYGDGFSADELAPNLDWLKAQRWPTDVVLIDQCWDLRFGDWQGNPRWPDLTKAAAAIRAAGYRPGIWTCCFLAEPRSQLFRDHQDWLLRDHAGKPVRFGMYATEHYVLDPSHPGVLGFLDALYCRLRSSGFDYHKIDFSRAVAHPDAVFHDRSCNRATAYRRALAAVRRGLGEDAYLNICGGLYGPSLGLADGQRSGSDVKMAWPVSATAPQAPLGPFTIKQNTLRGWMNRLWHNDPDALVTRRRAIPARGEPLSLGLMTDAEAETLALNQYLSGGIVCYSENLAEVEADRLLLLSRCSPSLGVAARILDLVQGDRFPTWFTTPVTVPGIGEWTTLAVVNWHAQPRQFQFRLDPTRLGLPVHAERFLVSSYQDDRLDRLAPGDAIIVGEVPAHGCRVLKIQVHRPGFPHLLATDGHYAMGGTELRGWRWDPLALDVDWPWPRALQLQVLDAHDRRRSLHIPPRTIGWFKP